VSVHPQEADELAGRQRGFADAKQRLLNERKGLEMAQEALEASLAEVRSWYEALASAPEAQTQSRATPRHAMPCHAMSVI